MKYDENLAYYKNLKDRINRVLEDYRQNRISEDEYAVSLDTDKILENTEIDKL